MTTGIPGIFNGKKNENKKKRRKLDKKEKKLPSKDIPLGTIMYPVNGSRFLSRHKNSL